MTCTKLQTLPAADPNLWYQHAAELQLLLERLGKCGRRDVPAARLYPLACPYVGCYTPPPGDKTGGMSARPPRIVIAACAGIHNAPMDLRFRGNDMHKTANLLAGDPNLWYQHAAELQLLLERLGK